MFESGPDYSVLCFIALEEPNFTQSGVLGVDSMAEYAGYA